MVDSPSDLLMLTCSFSELFFVGVQVEFSSSVSETATARLVP